MATQKSTFITASDAKPFDVTNSRKHGGVLKSAGDNFELVDTANGDDAIVLKLPVDANLKIVNFACDDLGTAGTVDIGFHTKNSDGTYSAVDADALANNIDVNSGAVALTDFRYSAKGIETSGQSAYTLAGLASRPAYGDIYLSITTDTGTTADGTVLLDVYYTE